MNQDNPTSSKLQPGTQVQVVSTHVYVASLVSPSNVEGFPASQRRFVLKRMAVPDKPGLVEVRQGGGRDEATPATQATSQRNHRLAKLKTTRQSH
ncbi:hypothetical protein Pst134EB_020481 [Puccinia striiformis f. sp. tritici]|nr:hypothetical protein Pst134EB_020481 [Puccinia striiformis f. sp. tritici]